MGDVYKKLPLGSPVTAKSLTVYNETIDMLKWWKQQGRQGGGKVPGVSVDPSAITVKNNCGADRARFELLVVGAPIFTAAENDAEFKNKIAVKGEAADGTAGETYLVLQSPLASAAIGRRVGVISGATVAKIEVLDADHECAVYSSSHPEYFESAATGTIKLIYNPGAGTGWGIVLLGGGSGSNPTLIRGLAVGGVATTDTTFYIDNVVVMQGKGFVAADCPGYESTGTKVKVNNRLSWTIDDNGIVYAALDFTATETPFYDAIQAACPA